MMQEENPANRTEQEERSYIAFISYRHCSLDREAAERVQKKIENYTVPKEFRDKVGGKKLGLCFRDEDELPASASLTDSIYYALDHSRFLIVICTPDLPKSLWCEAEILYFLKTHDRDHILAVLADGDPAESFSPHMLHTFDEDGRITGDTEPLAANVAGKEHSLDKKAFRKEIVRIFAALIGCPFDELWQRERRARTRRIAAGSAAAFAVMAVFLGVLLNRNAQIAAQNTQIIEQNDQIRSQLDQITSQNEMIESQNAELQRNLSEVLVDSGFAKLDLFDRAGAIQDALKALENMDSSIYDPRAELLLSRALGAYYTDQPISEAVFKQPSEIRDIYIAGNGEYVLTVDTNGIIRCLDTENCLLQWEMQTGDPSAEIFTEQLSNCLIYKTLNGTGCLSLSDGLSLWYYEQTGSTVYGNRFCALSNDGTIFVVANKSEDSAFEEECIDLIFLDTSTGEEKRRVFLHLEGIPLKLSSFSGADTYGRGFSEKDTRFVCSFSTSYEDEAGNYIYTTPFFLIHMDTFEVENIGAAGNVSMICGLSCYDDRDDVFIAAYFENRNAFQTSLCEKQNGQYEFNNLWTSHNISSDDAGTYYNYNKNQLNDCNFLSREDMVVLFSDNRVLFFDRTANELVESYALSGRIVNAFWLDEDEGLLELFTSDGWIYCYRLGGSGYGIYFFRNFYGFTLDQADIRHTEPQSAGFIRFNNVDEAWDRLEDDSCYFVVSGTEKGTLYRVRVSRDPNSVSIQLPDDRQAYFSGYQPIPDTDDGLCFFRSSFMSTEEYVKVYRVSSGTGEILSETTFKKQENLPLPETDVVLVDENRFLSGRYLYNLDGTVEEYAEPVKISKYSTAYPSKHIRLNDGRILSYSAALMSQLDYSGPKHPKNVEEYMYVLWLDGEPVVASTDFGTAVLQYYNYTENEIPVVGAGSNGFLFTYGKRMIIGGDTLSVADDAGYVFMNALTQEVIEIPDPQPDGGEFQSTVGTKDPVMAAAYENGAVWLFDLAEGSAEKLEADYQTGEIRSICFSEGDEYLAILTKGGRLDLYNVRNNEKLFEEQIGMSGFSETGEVLKTFSVIPSGDGSRLAVSAGTDVQTFSTVLIDLNTKTIVQKISDAVAVDPDSRVILRQSNKEILSCPIYDINALMTWAKEKSS